MKVKIEGFTILLLIAVVLSACIRMSIIEKDKRAELNGSFEITRAGLPVNWYIYAPASYKKGYDLIFDTIDAKEGKQSLKFLVSQVESPHAGWRNPGFFGGFNATIGNQYNVSFWIKNSGCDFKVKVASEGNGMHSEKIIRTSDTIHVWKYFEYKYTVPETFPNVRFEVNIFSPGSFWIDDVRIEKISE